MRGGILCEVTTSVKQDTAKPDRQVSGSMRWPRQCATSGFRHGEDCGESQVEKTSIKDEHWSILSAMELPRGSAEIQRRFSGDSAQVQRGLASTQGFVLSAYDLLSWLRGPAERSISHSAAAP